MVSATLVAQPPRTQLAGAGRRLWIATLEDLERDLVDMMATISDRRTALQQLAADLDRRETGVPEWTRRIVSGEARRFEWAIRPTVGGSRWPAWADARFRRRRDGGEAHHRPAPDG